jgi:hypothetical protein
LEDRQIRLCQLSHSQLVRFESIGQLLRALRMPDKL